MAVRLAAAEKIAQHSLVGDGAEPVMGSCGNRRVEKKYGFDVELIYLDGGTRECWLNVVE
jgi:hypothetical protein